MKKIIKIILTVAKVITSLPDFIKQIKNINEK